MPYSYKELKALQRKCGTYAVARMLQKQNVPLNIARIVLASGLTVV